MASPRKNVVPFLQPPPNNQNRPFTLLRALWPQLTGQQQAHVAAIARCFVEVRHAREARQAAQGGGDGQ